MTKRTSKIDGQFHQLQEHCAACGPYYLDVEFIYLDFLRLLTGDRPFLHRFEELFYGNSSLPPETSLFRDALLRLFFKSSYGGDISFYRPEMKLFNYVQGLSVLFAGKPHSAQDFFVATVEDYPDFAPGFSALANSFLPEAKFHPKTRRVVERYYNRALSIYPEYRTLNFPLRRRSSFRRLPLFSNGLKMPMGRRHHPTDPRTAQAMVKSPHPSPRESPRQGVSARDCRIGCDRCPQRDVQGCFDRSFLWCR